MKSMTGYGISRIEGSEKIYECQISSVNRRFLDIQIKMPSYLAFLEKSIRDSITKSISRGSVTVRIQIQSKDLLSSEVSVKPSIAKQVLNLLQDVEKETDQKLSTDHFWSSLIPLSKEIVQTSGVKVDAVEKSIIHQCLENAVLDFESNRNEEGLGHRSFVLSQICEIKNHFSQIEIKKEESFNIKLEKLKSLISQYIPSPDEDQHILKESVLLADKLDISEEIERFQQHLQALQILVETSSDQPIAKKFEFILQEMNREINTTSVKSNHIDIQKHCIEVKCFLEKMREVIQNVE